MKPQALKPGDKVAILSPASIIDPTLVEGAVNTLRQLGLQPVVMPHTLGQHGTYSGTRDQRIADFTEALTDPTIKAILCSRGGYGAVHLLQDIAPLVAANPKWLIGFSDISALHALWHANGIESLHASMAKQLTLGPDTQATQRLMKILTGSTPAMQWVNTTTQTNRQGTATATITGGNLAVLDALIGTPYDTLKPGNILFIEDIAEPIYKIERMLYHLKLNGTLANIAALIVGRFTEYKPDRNFPDMESMIASMVSEYDYPVAFDAPIGHIGPENMPVLHGSTATLTVTETHCVLQ